MAMPEMDFDAFGAAITAVGALGIAAFGVTEALGKALVLPPRFLDSLSEALDQDQVARARRRGMRGVPLGLPYVGFGRVRHLLTCLRNAMRTAYGPGWEQIVAQQYRDGRSKGEAPATIRQGVKLALPMMSVTQAAELIDEVWGLEKAKARSLAKALTSTGPDTDDAEGAALAGQFALVLDTRITAAFSQAEERYGSVARMAAGATAVVLSIAFNYGLVGGWLPDPENHEGYAWPIAVIIGLAAVPLAPIAKDLASSLSDATKAWRQIGGK